MFKELFSDCDILSLPVISMLLFLAVFIGMLFWVLAKKRKPYYDHMAALPLDDATESMDTEEMTR